MKPWVVAFALVLAFIKPVGAQQYQTFGGPINAMGPGVLPLPGTPLLEGYAHFNAVVCACNGGYAQNWVYWQLNSTCSSTDPFPAIGIFDETTGQAICPPVEPGMGNTVRLLGGNHFSLMPSHPTISAGDLLAVEVTKQGLCNGEAAWPFQTGGEIWEDVLLSSTADCPSTVFATPIPTP